MKQNLIQVLIAIATVILMNLLLSTIGWLLTDADVTFKECARFPFTLFFSVGFTVLVLSIVYHKEGSR